MGTSNSDYTIFIGTTLTADGVAVISPITNLTAPVLKDYPGGTIKVTGTHIGNGVYLFTKPDDGRYKVYESDGGAEITSWGGVNGRWIGDDVLDYYATSALVYSVQSSVTSLESATGALNSAIGNLQTDLGSEIWNIKVNYAALTGTNTFTNRQTYTGGITLSGGNSYLYSPMNLKTYGLCDSPVYGTSVVNKSYVTSVLENAIQSFAASGYQESVNTIRLMPGGTKESGKVYLTTGEILDYAHNIATTNRRITAEIKGTGTTRYINLTPLSSDPACYSLNYVSWRGIGSDVGIQLVGGETLSASVLGNSIYENLYFCFDSIMALDSCSYTNEVFRNDKFYNSAAGVQNYYTCRFEGINYFTAAVDNSFITTDCEGVVFTNKLLVVNGSSSKLIQILSDGRIYYNNSLISVPITGAWVVSANTEFIQPVTIPQLLLGAQNLMDNGNGIEFSSGIQAADYLASDGSTGMTSNISFKDFDGSNQNVYIKNGIIVDWTKT